MLFRSRRWWGCLRAGGRRLRRGTGPGFQCSSGHFNAAWHHPPMSAIHEPLPSLHRVPRASSAWIWVLLAAHLAVVLAWWQLGWRVGLLLLRSEEHTSELQSLMRISYAVFCLQKKKKQN